jgi:hypothetical protein
VYHAINEAGEGMRPEARDDVVEEAMLAFAMNVEVGEYRVLSIHLDTS